MLFQIYKPEARSKVNRFLFLLQKVQYFDVGKGPGFDPGTCIFTVALNFSLTLGCNVYNTFHEAK